MQSVLPSKLAKLDSLCGHSPPFGQIPKQRVVADKWRRMLDEKLRNTTAKFGIDDRNPADDTRIPCSFLCSCMLMRRVEDEITLPVYFAAALALLENPVCPRRLFSGN